MSGEYTCAKCKQTKPKTEFHRCSKSRQNVVSRCKLCRHLESKADYLRRKSYFQEYARNHRSRINERHRIKNRSHRDKRNKIKQLWRQKHPLDYKRTVINSNATRYNAVDRVRLQDLEALWTVQQGICPFTGISLTPQKAVLLFIVHPQNGGKLRIENLIFTTRQVHKYKATLSLEDFCTQAGLDAALVVTDIGMIHSKLFASPI